MHGLVHIPTRFALYRAAIALGVPWCVAGISAGLARTGENNAQAAQSESTLTILINQHSLPETDREFALDCLALGGDDPSAGRRWHRDE